MTEAVGPAVGCLMATFGTNMISSCIFNFEDPADLRWVEKPGFQTLVIAGLVCLDSVHAKSCQHQE